MTSNYPLYKNNEKRMKKERKRVNVMEGPKTQNKRRPRLFKFA